MDLSGQLGMILNGGRLIVTNEFGKTLTTNPITIKIPDVNNPGLFKSLTLNSTYEWHDSSNPTDSDFRSGGAGMPFGVTTGVAWGDPRPFMHGITYLEDTAYIVSTPSSTLRTMPATANIGFKDTPASTASDNGVIVWTTDDLGSQLDGQPFIPFATTTATMNTSDDWLWALTDPEGVGHDALEYNFGERTLTFPTGQNGAVANYHLSSVAGAPPTWATPANIDYNHRLTLHGMLWIEYATTDAGACTNGSGAVVVTLHFPYAVIEDTTNILIRPVGVYRAAAATNTFGVIVGEFRNGSFNLDLDETGGVFASLLTTDFTNAADDLNLGFWVRVF